MIGLLFAATLVGVQPETPSAAEYYTRALEATRAAAQPSYTTYHTKLTSSGMRFVFGVVKDDVDISLGWGRGTLTSATYNASFRQSDNRVTTDATGRPHPITVPLFNPGWAGIADWMQHGFFGQTREVSTVDVGESAQRVGVAPPTVAQIQKEPPTIATVESVAPGAYLVTDGGAAMCGSGAPGHKLLLRARRSRATHPLTSVVVDAQTMRFCTMDFRDGDGSAFSGYVFTELHLRDVDGNWLVNDGTADIVFRALGVRALHCHLAFENSDFQFPVDADEQ